MGQRKYTIVLEEKGPIRKLNRIFWIISQEVLITGEENQSGKTYGSR
jgi:hypothetical protein